MSFYENAFCQIWEYLEQFDCRKQGLDTFDFYHCQPLKTVEVSWPWPQETEMSSAARLFQNYEFYFCRNNNYVCVASAKRKYVQVLGLSFCVKILNVFELWRHEIL